MRHVLNCFFFLLVMCVMACVPESKKILTEVDVRLDDPVFQDIMDHEYLQQTDSLLAYTNNEDPTYRFLAARSFASFQDPRALDSLYRLLNDPVVKVRAMAAHAIGQIGKPESAEALLAGFRQKDTMSIDNRGNHEILVAIGKLGNAELAELMISAEGYRDSDTLLMEGITESLYHFALRDIHSESITAYLVDAIRNDRLSDRARLYAAHNLSRSRNLDIEKYKFQIAEAMVDEDDTHIKMALASALKHSSDKEIETLLLDQLDLELDYRVTCNIIRTLTHYEYISVIEKILELLDHPNLHVAICAAEYIRDNGIREDIYIYRQYIKEDLAQPVKGKLYEAVMAVTPAYYSKTKSALRWQIQQQIESLEDPYVIRLYLKALSHDPESYPYLMDFAKETESQVLRAEAVSALATLMGREEFDQVFRSYNRYHKTLILDYFKELLKEGDEGLTTYVADAITNEQTSLTELIDSTDFLLEAREALDNPGQIEGIHAVDRALARLRGVNTPNLTKVEEYSMPDWSVLENYNGELKALVKTGKGLVELELYPKRAPAAVMNFIQLSEDNFYDQQLFHRVVPNFVVQAGSPRGDSFGGKAYVIRSNVAQSEYNDEGYLGMASAGLHTESTQWFITHSPTPHLNGKYTLFGKVIDGMDVVHDLAEGDKILDIIITGLQ